MQTHMITFMLLLILLGIQRLDLLQMHFLLLDKKQSALNHANMQTGKKRLTMCNLRIAIIV